ncbi:MAG: FAD-binding protein [Bacteroidetes bacterium]|nr:FAD-binding protein [Bacteroidota bacterium]
MQQQSDFRFTNWAKNETCVAKKYFVPETEAELVEAIAQSKTVRFTGTGHSWSSICLNTDALINLDRYNKILLLDKAKLQITVQPGIKLWQLNEELDKHGLALINLGSIAKQSLAGAMCTATHGTGIQFQILASQIEAFTLIKANGEKLVIHHTQDKDLFNLCVVNLGCLGVVSEITLNVVSAFNLHDRTFVMSVDKAINQLHEMVNSTDHFKLWWFPHVDDVVVYQYTRTQQKTNDSRFRQWLMDEILSVSVYRLFLKIGNINRNWRKKINSALVKKFMQPLNRIEKSYKVFNVPEPPVHREVEWAFDISVAKDLLREYTQMINASAHRINFIQEIRFTKADEYALSPCYQRDTIWLGAYRLERIDD